MCKHEKVCHECVKDEISKLEEKVAELKKKLPHEHTHVIIQKEYMPVPYYPQYICGSISGPAGPTNGTGYQTGYLQGDINNQLLV